MKREADTKAEIVGGKRAWEKVKNTTKRKRSRHKMYINQKIQIAKQMVWRAMYIRALSLWKQKLLCEGSNFKYILTYTSNESEHITSNKQTLEVNAGNFTQSSVKYSISSRLPPVFRTLFTFTYILCDLIFSFVSFSSCVWTKLLILSLSLSASLQGFHLLLFPINGRGIGQQNFDGYINKVATGNHIQFITAFPYIRAYRNYWHNGNHIFTLSTIRYSKM